MRSARAIAAALALASTAAFTAPVSAASAATPDGIHVKDGRIYEADGTELILRGVNHAHAWYNNETGAYADIAHAGANSVRTVLSNGVTWSRTSSADVAQLISLSEDAQLINMLEVHDTTGYGDSSLDSPDPPSPKQRTTGSASKMSWSVPKTTSSLTWATNHSGTTTPPMHDTSTTPPPRSHDYATPVSPTPSWWTPPAGARLATHHARQRRHHPQR